VNKENWTYEGPENGVVMPRNLKGNNGRVKIEPSGRSYILDLDGIRFNIPRGLLEELVAAGTSILRPYAGLSIFERIMTELDPIIDRLMSGDGAAEDGRDPGRAEAYTRCLALIRNAYQPDYEAEKERAMERYEAREEV
jgi:hypothetical protein